MDKPEKLSVLYVEDSQTDFEWLRQSLGDSVIIHHANCLSECHQSGQCDVALLDLNLPESIGIDTVKKFRAGLPHLPVVVLTHVNDPHLEAECLAVGAHAYYNKDEFNPKALIRSMEAAAIGYHTANLRDEEVRVHRKTLAEIKAATSIVLERLAILENKSNESGPR